VIRYAIRFSVIAIVFSSSAGLVVTTGHAQEHMFAVTGVVVDQQGAPFDMAEVVFKGGSGTIVAHTDASGSVLVNLEAGKYVLTASHAGFITTQLVDFSVPGPTAHDFRVVLKFDPNANLRMDRYVSPPVPNAPWGLPPIKDKPTQSSLPATQPDYFRLSTPIVKAWREIPLGSPVYALDDAARAKDWLERAWIQSIEFQTGIWYIWIEPGYSVFRIYPYLSKESPQPSAYQGIVLKVKGTLSIEDLLAAIRNRTPTVRIDEYDVFGADSVSVQRYSRPHDRDGLRP
jgi:Carboxypeptidase regulatory-like domain